MAKRSSAKNSKKLVKERVIPHQYQPDDMALDEWQSALRKQFGIKQSFEIENIGNHPVFSDFNVYNPASKRTYKVAVRSEVNGLNFCSCPDFKVNLLGTCKHVENVLFNLKQNRRNKKYFKLGNIQYYSSISLKYGEERKVYLRIGENNRVKIQKLAKDYFDEDNYLKQDAFDKFSDFLNIVTKLDDEFRCYQDAIDYIIEVRNRNRRQSHLRSLFPEGIESEYFNTLLNAKLYSYQKEGILFAVNAGRCLISDDMGLGKTIQAIGASELLAREFNIEKVLIIAPTSLKYQWKSEIEKFTSRSVTVIEGLLTKRKIQYADDTFFKIASYNTIAHDLDIINQMSFDLVILDEAQRIKNWKTRTAQRVKQINSEYAFILTGTPLENRLDELHSIVQFADPYKLGALFRFLHKHEVKDSGTKVIGYRHLHEISDALSSIMLRRRKSDVLIQLPERVDQNLFVELTKQQRDVHNDALDIVARLVNKWQKNKFLSEADRKKLLINLGVMRMVSDSTYILDQKTRFDKKIDELMTILSEIFESSDEKVVIFSQWERMTRLVGEELDNMNIKYEYLHGGIPSVKRRDLLTNFAIDKNSRVFLSTDAGGVGLNLQAANYVINLDLPWNPAVLEQRIARVHRMGQGRHVSVINIISKNSIEERILSLIKFKKSVFEGVLDNGEDAVFVDGSKFNKIMETVEVLTDTAYIPQEHDSDELSEKEVYGEKEVTSAEIVPQEIETDVTEDTAAAPEFDVKESIIQPEDKKEEMEVETTEKAEPKLLATDINDLISTGINFLQKFGSVLADKKSTKEIVSSFIKKDENTGNMSINIPIKDEKIVEKVVDVFDTFLRMLSGK